MKMFCLHRKDDTMVSKWRDTVLWELSELHHHCVWDQFLLHQQKQVYILRALHIGDYSIIVLSSLKKIKF